MHEVFQTVQTVIAMSFMIAVVALWFGRKPAKAITIPHFPYSRKTIQLFRT